MPKEKLTLSVDKEVVEKAKILGMNISEITERVLKGYTSAERPEGSLHDAYKDLFDSIQPLLKEFDCSVKVAESWIEAEVAEGEVERVAQEDESYLTANGSFLIKSYVAPENYYISDIKKIPPEEFLSPEKILSNLVTELAKSQEKRKEKMDGILMAKRIIEAMSETLLKKQPTKEK
jgi:hypothetical protein